MPGAEANVYGLQRLDAIFRTRRPEGSNSKIDHRPPCGSEVAYVAATGGKCGNTESATVPVHFAHFQCAMLRF